MKRLNLIPAVFILCFLLLFSTSALAEDTNVLILTPSPDSSIQLEKVIISENTEDEATITIEGERPANSIPINFHLEIDSEEGTYTTTPITNSIPEEELQYEIVEEVNSDLVPIPQSEVSATYLYSATVRAVTDDPVGADLNSTKQVLKWYDFGSTVDWSTRILSTWAANPSQFGTHWFRSSSGYSGSPSFCSGSTCVSSSIYASYYNWDFMLNSKRTDVKHNVTIRANNNGTYNYYVTWSKAGEGNYLLDLDVYTN